MVILARYFQARMDLPEKKSHVESGLNKRDRATGGFSGVYTHRKPDKKNLLPGLCFVALSNSFTSIAIVSNIVPCTSNFAHFWEALE